MRTGNGSISPKLFLYTEMMEIGAKGDFILFDLK
jgi:hypothetical protein